MDRNMNEQRRRFLGKMAAAGVAAVGLTTGAKKDEDKIAPGEDLMRGAPHPAPGRSQGHRRGRPAGKRRRPQCERTPCCALIAGLAIPALALAHGGGPHLMGTVKAVDSKSLTIETTDRTARRRRERTWRSGTAS